MWPARAIFLAALLLPQHLALSAATPEAEVKAAYLYKIASFVEWPAGGGGDFRLCVVGRSDIASLLEALVSGQRVQGRPVGVELLTSGQSGRIGSCQVLFLGRGAATARAFAAASAGQPVLTVCDRNNGTRGCVIDFIVSDGRVRLIIDRGQAERQRLTLSSKLMDVAMAVR